MLLERIEIATCGNREHFQLGPFSHRLNVVYGATGAGKSVVLNFLRRLMLGSGEGDWQGASQEACNVYGLYGEVVWSAASGLWHYRREADGTGRGRLHVTHEKRSGATTEHLLDIQYRENRAAGIGDQRPHHLMLSHFVLPSAGVSIQAMIEACQRVGLETRGWLRDDDEIARLEERLRELDRQLESFPAEADSQENLEARRQELEGQLARVSGDRSPVGHEADRRSRIVSRLQECEEDIRRLRRQESDLRRGLATLESELSTISLPRKSNDTALRVARIRRLQLEDLDTQLVRLCRALRELRHSHETSEFLDTESIVPFASLDEESYPGYPTKHPHRSFRPRLEAARDHLGWLLRYYERLIQGCSEARRMTRDPGDRLWRTSNEDGHEVEFPFFQREQILSWIDSLREICDVLSQSEVFSGGARKYDEKLARFEESLARTIQEVILVRRQLLEKVALEHQLSVGQLTEAFGDWRQCHDQPHLYQWLLSDRCPPYEEDVTPGSVRRGRLESEQRALLDELSRTANRLDDAVNDAKVLRQRLHSLPEALPVLIDHRHPQWLREELAEVQQRLRWLVTRETLVQQHRLLRARLAELQKGHSVSGEILLLASSWLQKISAGRMGHLFIDHASKHLAEYRSTQSFSDAQYRAATIALRMAAIDLLRQRGKTLPLILDEAAWISTESHESWGGLVRALTDFASAGNQVILFTSSREVAEGFRAWGAKVSLLNPPWSFAAQPREESTAPEDLPLCLNRELDTAWREAQNLDEDPSWYRSVMNRPPRPPQWERSQDGATVLQCAADKGVGSPRKQGKVLRAKRRSRSPYFLHLTSPVAQAPSIDAIAADRLGSIGIGTVGQLLQAYPRRLAAELQLSDVSPRVLRRWQAEAKLVCSVPQMRNFDARVIVGCGVRDAQQLAAIHPRALLQRVKEFLATERGIQVLRSGSSHEVARITAWIASGTQRGSGARLALQRQSNEIPVQETISEPEPMTTEQRFFLQLSSPVVDAPSIGPKMASKLVACGIDSVDRLLRTAPEEIARKLKNPKITPALVRQWQQQAVLVCRVPMLRGHDAQLLVAAGITEPEKLSAYEPSRLLSVIRPIARSSRGKRILRGGQQPDLQEVTLWVRCAKQNRQLRGAA